MRIKRLNLSLWFSVAVVTTLVVTTCIGGPTLEALVPTVFDASSSANVGAGPAPGPAIKSINPIFGPNVGGTTVKISGSGFTTNTTIFFGTNLPVSPVFLDIANLLVVTAPSLSGTVDLTVRNSDGQSALLTNAFTFTGGPLITEQPSVRVVPGGTNAIFMLTAGGIGPISYQWLFNGNTLTNSDKVLGATSNILTLVRPALLDEGNYSVVLRDNYGLSTSVATPLTFNQLVLNKAPEIRSNVRLRRVAGTLEMDVPAEQNPGTLSVYSSFDIIGLGSKPILRVTTNAPTVSPMVLTVSSNKGSNEFFYATRTLALSESDLANLDIAEDPDAMTFALWTMGMPTNLVSGTTHIIDFLLVGPSNSLASITAVAALSIVNPTNNQPIVGVTVSPATIQFTNGRSRASVTVSGKTSLLGATFAVSIPTLTGAASQVKQFTVNNTSEQLLSQVSTPITSSLLIPSPATQQLNPLPEALQFLSNNWKQKGYFLDRAGLSSPLPSPLLIIPVGTFGEWRGYVRNHNPDANFHGGLDIRATNGTTVLAARGGVVIHQADHGSLGYFITLDHLDGQFTCYLHLSSLGLPAVGRYLYRGDRLGQVANSNDVSETLSVPPHLHFEVRNGTPSGIPTKSYTAQTIGKDPTREASLQFPIETTQEPCVLKLVGLTQNLPSQIPYTSASAPPSQGTLANSIYVVVQILHPAWSNRLSPRRVTFVGDPANSPLVIDPDNTVSTAKLLPHDTNGTKRFGFAEYDFGHNENVTPKDKDQWFKYWFSWDTSSYSAKSLGPQDFTVMAESYSGKPTSWTLKWGPEIVTIEMIGPPENGVQQFKATIRAWLGVDGSSQDTFPWETGPDWYRCDLPVNGQWLAEPDSVISPDGLTLSEKGDGSLLTRVHFFKIKSPVQQITSLLTVRSLMTPAIAHQKIIPVVDRLELSMPNFSVLKGMPRTFPVIAKTSDGSMISNEVLKYQYEIDPTGIATVSQADGTITGLKMGNASIKVTEGGSLKFATGTITVIDGPLFSNFVTSSRTDIALTQPLYDGTFNNTVIRDSHAGTADTLSQAKSRDTFGSASSSVSYVVSSKDRLSAALVVNAVGGTNGGASDSVYFNGVPQPWASPYWGDSATWHIVANAEVSFSLNVPIPLRLAYDEGLLFTQDTQPAYYTGIDSHFSFVISGSSGYYAIGPNGQNTPGATNFNSSILLSPGSYVVTFVGALDLYRSPWSYNKTTTWDMRGNVQLQFRYP